MRRAVVLLLVLVGVGLTSARGQPSPSLPPSLDQGGTYLGLLFNAVPEVLYDQLPQLPRNQGVVVSHVLPGSPAARAHVCRHDLLLAYDGHKIRDCEHVARLIHDDRPGRSVRLALLRGGRELTAEVTLALGPALEIAPAVSRGQPVNQAAVTVTAVPLGSNQVKVTIEYYHEGLGRRRSVRCSGTPEEIDQAIQNLPARVQDPARVGLQRLRALDIQKNTTDR